MSKGLLFPGTSKLSSMKSMVSLWVGEKRPFSPPSISPLDMTDSNSNPSDPRGTTLSSSCLRPEDETIVAIVHHNVSNESMENICRICHESPSSEKLLEPCLCKGSMGKVHRSCLERWLGESGKNLCEICGQEYNSVRVPKYTGFRSFFEWLRNPMAATDTRNFFFDLACFFILTPLAGLSAWLCILGAQNTSFDDQKTRRHRNISHPRGSSRDISNSTWTSVGLLSLTGTLVTAYYIWIFIAVRYHIQIWREWQARNYIVTIQPLNNGDFSRPPTRPSPEPTPVLLE